MSLTKRQKYDYRDTDWRELKLIRVGHAIWFMYKRERARNGVDVREVQALLEACQTVWAIKKALRAQLAEERKVESAKIKGRFA